MLRFILSEADFDDTKRAQLNQLLNDPVVAEAVNLTVRGMQPTPGINNGGQIGPLLEGVSIFLARLNRLTQPLTAPLVPEEDPAWDEADSES